MADRSPPGADRRAPNLAQETPAPIDGEIRRELEAALVKKLRPLTVDGRQGDHAAVVLAVVGDARRAHELFVFCRGPTGLEALDRCIDYVDGIVDELARAGDERFLPLDWEGRPFAGGIVFVRGEVRDYVAEEAAAQLLGEAPPPRGLG